MNNKLKRKLQIEEDIGRGIDESKRKVKKTEMESCPARYRERPVKKTVDNFEDAETFGCL